MRIILFLTSLGALTLIISHKIIFSNLHLAQHAKENIELQDRIALFIFLACTAILLILSLFNPSSSKSNRSTWPDTPPE